jgi:alanine racemase
MQDFHRHLPGAHTNLDPESLFHAGWLGRPGPGCAPCFQALKSRLIEVKELTPRERFGAAAPIPIAASMRLGVIPVGMGDGFHRLNAGSVLVRGRRVPILARPSLEHARLDLTTVPKAVVGDEVVLIGRQGTAEITPDEVAERHGFEPLGLGLALGVGPRVARVYIGGDPARRADGRGVARESLDERRQR